MARAISASSFGQTLRDDIVKEVRDNGIKPELAESTIKTRRYLQGHNSTHPAFRPDKSNLTITGQLLDSVRAKFIGSKLVFIVDSLKKKHSRYKTGGSGGKSKLPSLRDILNWQAEAGRDLAQVFTRKNFVEELTLKLKNAILKNYRN